MSNNSVFSQVPIEDFRQKDHDILDLFWRRWSPRAMSGKRIDQPTIDQLLEAARFAPSSFNEQPWRFIYAFYGTPVWHQILDNLVPFNKDWAKKSGALVVLISKQNFSHNEKPNQHASFDCGAAWQNLALQASSLNLVAHAMAGFDAEKLSADLQISSDFKIEVVIALGYPGDKTNLSSDLQEKEIPSKRYRLVEISQMDKGNFS